MEQTIVIKPVGKIYELQYIFEDHDGAHRTNELELDLENTTLDKAIEEELQGYIVIGALLYERQVYEDENGNKYFSETEMVREII